MKPTVFTSSLDLIATSYVLRCDAKYADEDIRAIDGRIRKSDYFEIGDFIPTPFLKGFQPDYVDEVTDDCVPVINTLSIQNLSINDADCRYILREDFADLPAERRLRRGDVLLTLDGGTSIGKPVYFDRTGDFTLDTHVAILRPSGLSPLGLVYLLASPIGTNAVSSGGIWCQWSDKCHGRGRTTLCFSTFASKTPRFSCSGY